MPSALDEVLALAPVLIDGYIDQNPAKKSIRVRAIDGREVTLYFRPSVIAAALREPGDLRWFGEPGWSPLQRWVALTSVHIDESINSLSKADEYVQRIGGFDPVGRVITDELDCADLDPSGAEARLGERVFDSGYEERTEG